ncbi:uncharacterized protein LOC100891435 isoform X2 [Strongylocentrotus purpuratus]|uniref:Uncharacterized protein n=1 Tax=Strongylocentrotus purpuratus TaxID=7668 RepID=A0A7M7HDQ3_STRPU|nr:uncharacterized protein LOC100891435 isoform X2 [Strongylocentrotus purpuratus]
MASFIGRDRLICHGSLVEGTQVSLKTGGSTLMFKSKNLGYYALKCLHETVYVLCRYKDVKKFSSGDPSNTYTFNGSMKVHRIIMAQGDTKYCDTILIVIHEGKPLYFKPLSQKLKKWREAFMYVASITTPPKETHTIQASTEPDGASTPHRTCHVSPSHTREKSRNAPHRSSPDADDQEEPAPSHLLPDVIDVDEEADAAEETRQLEKRKTRKSVYKKGSGGNYGVMVEINMDEKPEICQPGTFAHRQLSRQKSRSNEEIFTPNMDQLRISGPPILSASATLGRGYLKPSTVGPRIDRTRSAAGAFHVHPPSSKPAPTSPSHKPMSPSRKPLVTHIYDSIESDSDDDDNRSSDCHHLVRVLKDEQVKDRVVVELKKDHVAEGLVFVQINSSVYIATWKKSMSLHGRFQESIHIGDQLLQVNEQQALDLPIIRTVIQSSSTETVKLCMKRLPNAEVIHLTKKRTQPWGFDVIKNEITEVYEGADLYQHIRKCPKQKWIITELDHQPVSIQSCGKDEVKHRMTAAQTELALVLHPKDFIDKLLKKLQKSSIKKKRMTEYIV